MFSVSISRFYIYLHFSSHTNYLLGKSGSYTQPHTKQNASGAPRDPEMLNVRRKLHGLKLYGIKKRGTAKYTSQI